MMKQVEREEARKALQATEAPAA
ncbi:MAG: hypothetical protein RIR85_1114, partial [Pseudomonadota bacterium]